MSHAWRGHEQVSFLIHLLISTYDDTTPFYSSFRSSRITTEHMLLNILQNEHRVLCIYFRNTMDDALPYLFGKILVSR